jgi:RNA polymerase-interacting CarD/CdnL/TRCF family regulator
MKLLGIGSVMGSWVVLQIRKDGVTFRLPDDSIETLSLRMVEDQLERLKSSA